jgi:hypothetical protein
LLRNYRVPHDSRTDVETAFRHASIPKTPSEISLSLASAAPSAVRVKTDLAGSHDLVRSILGRRFYLLGSSVQHRVFPGYTLIANPSNHTCRRPVLRPFQNRAIFFAQFSGLLRHTQLVALKGVISNVIKVNTSVSTASVHCVYLDVKGTHYMFRPCLGHLQVWIIMIITGTTFYTYNLNSILWHLTDVIV